MLRVISLAGAISMWGREIMFGFGKTESSWKWCRRMHPTSRTESSWSTIAELSLGAPDRVFMDSRCTEPWKDLVQAPLEDIPGWRTHAFLHAAVSSSSVAPGDGSMKTRESPWSRWACSASRRWFAKTTVCVPVLCSIKCSPSPAQRTAGFFRKITLQVSLFRFSESAVPASVYCCHICKSRRKRGSYRK
jgi:hypothetical protein